MTPNEINVNWLKKENACIEGIDWFKKKISDSIAGDLLVEMLIKDKKFQWANWLIVRIMDYKQRVSYAVFAAEQVIDIFEKKYPNDKRPRKAIEAAKKCIENPSEKNRKAANATIYAANAAANAATNTAAYAAANAAADAAYAANAAAHAAAYAAYAAADNFDIVAIIHEVVEQKKG